MDIKTYVALRKEALRDEIHKQDKKPVLLIIQVNDDFASAKYIAGKMKDAEEVGMDARHLKLPTQTSEEFLLAEIAAFNGDENIDGIIVQLPLPKHISEDKVKAAIDPRKDVDGFNPLSQYVACTPLGIINYLKHENILIRGKNALVVGRSNIVGKPMAALLLKEDANVTIVHSRTTKDDLEFYLRHADIIVVAVGIKHFINEQQLKKDAVLVDVGINRGEDGTVTGDIKPDLDVKLQTPVPGGVGLLTRLALLENVWTAFKDRKK